MIKQSVELDCCVDSIYFFLFFIPSLFLDLDKRLDAAAASSAYLFSKQTPGLLLGVLRNRRNDGPPLPGDLGLLHPGKHSNTQTHRDTWEHVSITHWEVCETGGIICFTEVFGTLYFLFMFSKEFSKDFTGRLPPSCPAPRMLVLPSICHGFPTTIFFILMFKYILIFTNKDFFFSQFIKWYNIKDLWKQVVIKLLLTC